MKTRAFIFVSLSLFALKLLLISANEIITLPYDSFEYAKMSIAETWKLGSMPPGYPIWLKASRSFGVPQRLAIEFLLFLSSAYLGFVTRRMLGTIPALLLVALLTFSPFNYNLLDYALSDGFFSILSLFAIAVTAQLIFMQPARAKEAMLVD